MSQAPPERGGVISRWKDKRSYNRDAKSGGNTMKAAYVLAAHEAKNLNRTTLERIGASKMTKFDLERLVTSGVNAEVRPDLYGAAAQQRAQVANRRMEATRPANTPTRNPFRQARRAATRWNNIRKGRNVVKGAMALAARQAKKDDPRVRVGVQRNPMINKNSLAALATGRLDAVFNPELNNPQPRAGQVGPVPGQVPQGQVPPGQPGQVPPGQPGQAPQQPASSPEIATLQQQLGNLETALQASQQLQVQLAQQIQQLTEFTIRQSEALEALQGQVAAQQQLQAQPEAQQPQTPQPQAQQPQPQAQQPQAQQPQPQAQQPQAQQPQPQAQQPQAQQPQPQAQQPQAQQPQAQQPQAQQPQAAQPQAQQPQAQQPQAQQPQPLPQAQQPQSQPLPQAQQPQSQPLPQAQQPGQVVAGGDRPEPSAQTDQDWVSRAANPETSPPQPAAAQPQTDGQGRTAEEKAALAKTAAAADPGTPPRPSTPEEARKTADSSGRSGAATPSLKTQAKETPKARG
ncbi:hypothetical protein GCM10009804_41280 [Kribbella hippodromi]|uniref:Uncharacterized protein n=1 Tax=Kribbella hippodromi TaxID=434347 RepID=A0ABP4PHE2_9ACTN